MIQKKIEETRMDKEVTIIAVTKNHPTGSINSAIENGIENIGENKVQEAEKKFHNISKDLKIKLHLIGHLQKNKVRKAVKLFDYIQTVDSLSLAKRVDKIAKEEEKIQKIYLQINIANLENRYGFLTTEIETAAKIINLYKNLIIEGVMIIPPITKDKTKYLSYFKKAEKLQKRLQKNVKSCTKLSMGMSNDYEEAIQNGATHIRIGTALFGKREK